MEFDHIGVIVEDLAGGRVLLREAFRIRQWTIEFRDWQIGVSVQFGRDNSGICYEIVAPLSDSSPVSRALRDRVHTLNHVAYRVSDLSGAARRLIDSGFIPLGAPIPAVAFDNAPIQFFISDNRLLFELIEAPAHRHAYTQHL